MRLKAGVLVRRISHQQFHKLSILSFGWNRFMVQVINDVFSAVAAGLATLGVVLAALKVFFDLRHQSRKNFVERCEFSKLFLKECNDGTPMHPLSKQQGYFAIVGSDKLSVKEIVHLLKLKDSEKAIKYFASGRRYLRLSSQEGGVQIDFETWIERQWLRSALIYVGVFLYFVLWVIAWMPLLSLYALSKPYMPWQLGLLFALVLVSSAIYILRAANNLDLAQKLVASQEVDAEVAEFAQKVRSVRKAKFSRRMSMRSFI